MTSRTPHLAVTILALLSLAFLTGAAAVGASSLSPQAAALDAPYLVAVNAGGGAYTDSRGITFQADRPYAPGSWGFAGGQPFSTTERIENSPDQALYQTERFGMDAYRFDVPNGVYDVELDFAEIYAFTCPGRRVFDVNAEGIMVINDLDIFAAVGPYTPLVRTFSATVGDGRLDIEFPPAFPPGKVNGIVVRAHQEGTPTSTLTSTPSRTATGTRTPTSTGTMPPGGWPTATPPPSYEVRLNAGGGAYTDVDGFIWHADQAYTAGSWGYVGGSAFSTAHDIAGTADQQLYQASRFGMSEYRFDVPNGDYWVTLKFAEVYSQSCPTSRVFDVSLGATKVITDLDLANVPGRYIAGDFQFTTVVTGGQLGIVFSGTVDAPTINAIRVESFNRGPTPTVTVTPTPSNTATRTSTPSSTPTPAPPYDLRINAGDGQYVDADGNTWLADKTYTVGSWGYSDGQTYSVLQPIAGTEQDPLYQSERYWAGNGGYKFDVANGDFAVTLKFAELYYSAPGLRRFAVKLEGITVLDNFDVFAAAGGRFAATDRTFLVPVGDGQLNIDFIQELNAPKVNALRVARLAPATATATSTRTSTITVTPPPSTATRTATRTATLVAPSATATRTATSGATATRPSTATPIPAYEVRVNAGDGVYTDTLGAVWQADRAYSTGSWGYTDGQTYSVSSAIAFTADPKLYQSERYWASSGGYKFDVPNGTYLVELKFAELYYSGPGLRLFDVQLEGETILDNLDVFAVAGGRFRAYDRSFTTAVSDGQLNLGFLPVIGSAKINAIHVKAVPPPPTATATATSTPLRTATFTRTATKTATPVPAEVVLTSDADTVLYVVYPGTNYGAASTAYCGGYGYQNRDNGLPCLFHFDLSGIPENAIITNAEFQFYVTAQNGPGTITYTAFALLRPWAEMAATWNSPDGVVLWNEAGAEGIGIDREGTASGIGADMGFAAPANWGTINLTGLVQRWIDDDLENNGFKLQKTGGSAATLLVNMRESTANRPKLVVRWLPGGTPTVTATPTRTATATPTITPTPTATPVYDQRINVGDAAYTDAEGRVWAADQAYVAGSWGYVGGVAHSVSDPIANTGDPVLYQSERYWPGGGSYKLDVANGTYVVELKFAELYYNGPGYRQFNVKIEGVNALTAFDPWLAAGAKDKAVDRLFIVGVVDGQLNIDFSNVAGAATLEALRVARQ